MPNRILALDLHGSQLVAVVVETSFRGYQIIGHFAEPRDTARPFAEQVKSFLGAHPLASDTVLSSLPGDAVAFRIFEVPFKDWRKLQQTVPFELESQVPFSLDDAIVDFQVLSRSATGSRVFAALALRTRVAEHLKTLSEAGIDPAIIDFSPLSTLNVLQLFDGERPSRYVFVHLSGAQGTVALYQDGALESLRVLSIAGEATPSAVTREIAWSLKSLNGAGSGAAADPPALLVGGAPTPEVAEALRKETGATVQRFEDLPLRRVPAALHGRQGVYAAALGLALREIADEPTLGLNFRREEFEYSRGHEEMRGTLARLGILAAAVFVLFLASQAVAYFQLSGQARALQDAVRHVFQEALPGVPVVDEMTQLTQEVDRLRRQQQQLGLGPSGRLLPLEVLKQISERAPAEPRMTIDLFELSPERIHLKGRTSSFEAVETARKAIAESPLFADAQVKDPRTTNDGAVEFHLNITPGRGGAR